jgi:hypothetical protein
MSLNTVILQIIAIEECMRGERHIIDGNSRHEKNIALGKSEYVFLYLSRSWLPLLIIDLFERENLIDWGNDVPENIIFWNYIGVSVSSIDNHELILILIIPDDPINSIGD